MMKQTLVSRGGTMGYWDATDKYLAEHGGHGPTCPHCGKEMFAEDDHGRFSCFCAGSNANISGLPKASMEIPQIPADVELTDEQKAQIPPMNRLHHTITPAEQNFMKAILNDDPEAFVKASKEVDEERAEADETD